MPRAHEAPSAFTRTTLPALGSEGGCPARAVPGAMAGVFDIDLDQPEEAASDEELEEGVRARRGQAEGGVGKAGASGGDTRRGPGPAEAERLLGSCVSVFPPLTEEAPGDAFSSWRTGRGTLSEAQTRGKPLSGLGEPSGGRRPPGDFVPGGAGGGCMRRSLSEEDCGRRGFKSLFFPGIYSVSQK